MLLTCIISFSKDLPFPSETISINPAMYFYLQILTFQVILYYPYTKRHILDSSKVKEFADHNFKFNENGRKFAKQVENTVGKGEIAHYEQFLFFPQCFQKTCIGNT